MAKKKEKKIRIYNLAKELNISNKELLNFLKEMKIKAKSSLSTVTESEAKKVKKKLKSKKPQKAKAKKKKKDKETTKKKKTTKKTKAKKKKKPAKKKQKKETKTEKKDNIVHIREVISVRDLSEMIDVSPSDIIKACLTLGLQVTINQKLDFDTASLLAEEFGYKAKLSKPEETTVAEKKTYGVQKKPPVVTVMGHVDHGKTTLLDYIRKTQVADHESGGITQKIGAYHINHDGHKITFIDTPGHEAFTSMRAGGANVTDIVILVVAANEGVKPQTVEAINHARAANAPIIVAINKIDLPSANPNKVLAELAEKDVMVHEYGGHVIAVQISALKGEGIEDLLDAIILQSEDLDLKAPAKGPGRGIVLETKMRKGIGNVATVVVKEGEIKVGDSFIAGAASGKVRLILDENDKRLKSTGVSSAVQIAQFESLPETGVTFRVVEDMKTARNISDERKSIKREKDLGGKKTVSLSTLYEKIEKEKKQILKIVIKGEDAGSVDALSNTLTSLSTEKVQIQVINSGVGPITKNDVMFAGAYDAIIIGFKVKPYRQARKEANKRGVEIKTYDVIFEITEDIEKAMLGLLKPEKEEIKCGEVEIKRVFEGSNIGKVAGCFVLSGEVHNNDIAYVTRNGKELTKTKIENLKRFDKDVKTVEEGYECGIRLSNFDAFKKGDLIESYKLVEKEKTL